VIEPKEFLDDECPYIGRCKQLINKDAFEICKYGFPGFNFDECFRCNDLQSTQLKTAKEWKKLEAILDKHKL
jgi:hypothetical protein